MYILIFISFTLFCQKYASKVSNKQFEEVLLIGFLFYSASIILSGYILSSISIWNNKIAWSILPFSIGYLIYLFFNIPLFSSNRLHTSTFKITGSSIQKMHEFYRDMRGIDKIVFTIIITGILIVSIFQFYVIFHVAPNEWDSMTGHLNRILYFLQRGNFDHFIGTNWNIDTYPKSFCSIQAYPFIMFGQNEYYFKLPNISSYWVLFIGMYGILKRLNIIFKVRVLISSLFLLTPIAIIQSTTTDSDIVLAAYLVLIVYFIFSFRQSENPIYIYLAAFAFSIALSHKITFAFSFAPLLLLYVYTGIFKKWKHLIISHLICVSIITLPTGYVANIYYYGHPIGPETATKHQSIERAGSTIDLFKSGSRNTMRYFLDLMNLDGLRNIQVIENAQIQFKESFLKLDKFLNTRLESDTNFTIIPFAFNKRFEFYNGTPIFGSLFIFILLPSLILLFLRKQPSLYYVLFCAFLLHFLALSYSAAYDPWKGRYMLSSLVYLLPLSTLFIPSNFKSQRFYLPSVFILVSLSAIFTIVLHLRALPFPSYGKKSISQMTRMEQLTVSRPDITAAYTKFDSIVPQNAVVALATINDDYEYPLWGATFSRVLIPINPFEKGLQAIPKDANYLFFDASIITPTKSDIRLGTDLNLKEGIIVPGEDYYLRKL